MPRTSTRDHAGEARVTAAELAHVIVPLDGSDESARAVPVARQLAALLGADLTFLGVATPGMDRGALQVLLEEAAAPVGGDLTVAVVDGEDGVAPAIAAVGVQLPRHVVCMASHGRGRAAGLVGSVATGLAAAAREPLVVVGPEVPVGHHLAGRLVACVDGSMRSEAGLPAMAAWARSLRLAMTLVTVAEPIPAPVTPGAPYRRTHGPSMGAEDYVEGLVRCWEGRGVDVDGDAVYDPVSVPGGLAHYLRDRPAGLVGVTSPSRTGVARVVLGSVAAGIVRHAPAPVLLVPPPAHPEGR